MNVGKGEIAFNEREHELSDFVENIVAKGEIARSEQFLLLPQCFQNLFVVDESK